MMEAFDFKTINWDESNKLLDDIIGIHAVELATLSHSNINKPAYCLRIDNWQDLYDIDVYKIICNEISSEKIYIISDLSYSKNIGVFCINNKNIEEFILAYNEVYDEFIFEDDAFLIFPDENIMIIYQHEGYYMLYTLPLN
ncbi:hypothetical protein [Pectobacterium parmentieri]|uniref:hypothetical protein n=1 Tax=Pectobacterium parmentieri TaxID=1905730 RepID=UPI0018E0251A|nr:hypothetical protein [Pectobacterium parmentieri]MBI0552776.1 hypothetical protein [Pectobacterium parmentieri]MBI0561799.1 hypothetical protein [Pectobacterium parmentieri]MBI0566070.1 hypothetical protein [Pectobacterium parmentieri]